jgi:glycosyltransferase involved in cell wall biosynthesis
MKHLVYLAWGFPPAAKSCAYRMLATANSFARNGWDVTVVTLTHDSWVREHGLDSSLLALVDERVETVRLPLYRHDLDTDIRAYGWFRARRPVQWRRWTRRRDQLRFPEPVFGPWRPALTEAVEAIHSRKPADLVLTSAVPYTFFAPALELHRRHGVPFVLDYRDAWALDIIKSKVAFGPNSRKGWIEKRLLDSAHEAWFVNSPIRDWYAERYPVRADSLHVVRNGSDVAVGTSMFPVRVPDSSQGLTIGYLGTVSFAPSHTRAVCEGWRIASERDEIVGRSRLEFRGHIGAGWARGANSHARIISRYASCGVSFGGPVAKAQTAALYSSWDALLLALVGGQYVTSGKVFDYMSTGLPVMSAHEPEHAAAEVLQDYPLWVRNQGVDPESLADAFVRTAHLAVAATEQDRLNARRHAEQFERYAQMEPAIVRLSNRFNSASAT